ncbi:MAG: outer membrane beta-barrel domain-containing protein [Deltaproteobacteria bacterium]|nr:outer membrane beta-barrel domain-containing protein [Deltaproteobacteria bacterium]
MMMQKSSQQLARTAPTVGAVLLAVAILSPGTADARRSLLEGQPAVRHKMELREKRFELAPTFDMSVAADNKDTYSGGLKLEYHLTDSLSIGAQAFFGTSRDSALGSEIKSALGEPGQEDGIAPSRKQYEDHVNRTPLHGGAYVALTPWFGKLSVFQKTFVNFDVYIKGGMGVVKTESAFGTSNGCSRVKDRTIEYKDGTSKDVFDDPRNDCPNNAGTNIGALAAVGIHAFINKWVAVDLSMSSYWFNDNPSGLDFNADGWVDGKDKRFLNHLFFGAGCSFFLPPKIRISE